MCRAFNFPAKALLASVPSRNYLSYKTFPWAQLFLLTTNLCPPSRPSFRGRVLVESVQFVRHHRAILYPNRCQFLDDRLQSESARCWKPEFAARFELGEWRVPGGLIPVPFC